jgi:arsenate reductase (thioredoxin)
MEDMKIKVLFLCTHNSARSQMAEAFLNHMGSDKFEAYSAGLEPKDINTYTKQVMSEIGIDISSQYPKALRDFMGKTHFGYLITVCAQAEDRCPSTFPGMGKRLFWDFEDPDSFAGSEEEKLSKFREIRDQIRHKIEQWLSGQTG